MNGLEVIGWVAILLGIGLSIGLHEIGHLVPAKKFGVRVTQYMVGFGPTMWSKHTPETEYGIKWLPIGGYIRMIGMFPPEKGTDGTVLRAGSTGRWSTLVADARKSSLQEVRPEDTDRVFYKLPVHKRVIIMFGGPFMNLLLAFVFFGIALCLIGVPSATPTAAQVTACVPTTANPTGVAKAGVCVGSAKSPAVLAGLQPGDTITAVNATQTPAWTDVQQAIVAAGEGPATLTVERGGETLSLTANLVVIPRPATDSDGNLTGGTVDRAFLGMAPAVARETQPLVAIPQQIWANSVHAVGAIITLPARVVDLVHVVTSDAPRDPNGIIGVVGVSRVAGDYVASDTPVLDKATFVVGILGGLNLFLFLFNLIPLLPLDGGHIAGALWEGIKRSYARVRHRPDPGPVDVAKALPVAYAVSILLIAMSVVILYADIVKPVTLQ